MKSINTSGGLEDKMKELKVVLVQPNLLYNPKKTILQNDTDNLNHALDMIKSLKPNKQDLIVFPELYPCVAELHIDSCDKLLGRARELNSYIIAGETYEGKNTTTLIDPEGNVVDRAYKVNLSKEEIGHVKPGKKPGLFNINGTKVGILTCWDFAFANLIEDLKERGADLIVNPNMNVLCFVGARQNDARHYSAYFEIPIASANLAGVFKAPWNMVHGGGRSEVVAGTKRNVYELTRPAKESDFITKALGSEEGVLKYTFKL